MKILFLSHSPDSGTFKVGSHHLARELSLLGHEVAHVSSPVTLLHLRAIRDSRTRRALRLFGRASVDAAGVRHVVPLALLPARYRPLPRARKMGLDAVTRSAIRVGFGRPDVILLDQPYLSSAFAELSPRLRVYRPTDAHVGAARRHEEACVGLADAVVATSAHVLSSLGAMHIPTLVLENGVEWTRFALPDSERAGMIYVGAIDHRLDVDAVAALAAAYPEQRLTLAGPVSLSEAAKEKLKQPNIDLLGPVSYVDAPSLLARHRVGLLPLSPSAAINQGRSPMKYYEYLAAGLNILGLRTETLARRTEPGVFLYSDRADLVEASAGALNAPINTSGRECARSFDWSARAEELWTFLAGTMDGR